MSNAGKDYCFTIEQGEYTIDVVSKGPFFTKMEAALAKAGVELEDYPVPVLLTHMRTWGNNHQKVLQLYFTDDSVIKAAYSPVDFAGLAVTEGKKKHVRYSQLDNMSSSRVSNVILCVIQLCTCSCAGKYLGCWWLVLRMSHCAHLLPSLDAEQYPCLAGNGSSAWGANIHSIIWLVQVSVLQVRVADGRAVKVNAFLTNVRLDVTSPKRVCEVDYKHRVSAITNSIFT